MSCRVNHLNKKTGVTYVYESVSLWDKEKHQPRSKQVCIGKIDPNTGTLIPSKRLQAEVPAYSAEREAVSSVATAAVVGPSLILDALSKRLGLAKILKSVFPEFHGQILTMAYYLAAHGGPLSQCVSWTKTHEHPSGAPLEGQRISEILGKISTGGKQTFMSAWMERILEDDFLCYDITSVSSYSELNEYIRFGHNRDRERLPQLNLAMLFGQKSRIPVYYHRIPGNITDVQTVHNLLETFKRLEVKSLHYVLDRGFYSKKNIDELLQRRDHFTISVPLHNRWVREAIDEIHDTVQGPEGYRMVDDEALYVHSGLYPWGEERRRCYLHLYYNDLIRSEAVNRFNHQLLECKEELESGKPKAEHQDIYDEFFILSTTPVRGKRVSYNTEAVNKHINRYAGFQALLTTRFKEPLEALQVYRDKDVVEKCFDDLKNVLDMKRLRMHSIETVDGRLFVQFIALILMSELRRAMRESKLIEWYTVRELLLEMDPLTKIRYEGKYGLILTEVTKPQREILELLKIDVPASA
ncbi:MAG: transposase [Spirochaetota bacterium]